jgi:hypothetical protein
MSCKSVIMGPSELSPSRRRRTLRLDDGMMPPNVRQVLGENLNCSESSTARRVLLATAWRKSLRVGAVALTKEMPETFVALEREFSPTPQAETNATQLDAAGISPNYVD